MAIENANRLQELGRFYQALRDRPLEPDDPAYVAELHQSRFGDAVSDLAGQILWSEGGGTYLFTGQRGTGKSTELRRLRKILRDAGCTVFLLNMTDYVNETQPIEIGDFLISLMGALSDRVERDIGAQPAQRGYWERLGDFLRTDVSLKEIDLSVVKASLKEDVTIKERIQNAARGHVARLRDGARSFSREVLALVREKLNDPQRKVVIVADSLERLRGVSAETARRVFDSAVLLFSGNAENLQFPGLHVVYSVPPYLSALTANLGGLYGGRLYALASAHLFERPRAGARRQISVDGLVLMLRLVEMRYAPWREVFSEAGLRRLAVSSGGDIRDFFGMISACLVKARSPALALPVEDELIDRVAIDMRREMLPIANDDKDWLKKIASNNEPNLESVERLSTLARYFDERLVLNYRNGEDWYDVHPLLWELIDRHEPAASGGPA